jgi:hypothetical protein
VTVDPVVERYTAEPVGLSVTEIPWPAAWGLKTAMPDTSPELPLPDADVVLMTFTAAEKQALAILSPGLAADNWQFYTNGWDQFESHLTWKSPAKEVKRLGEYAVCEIAGKKVLLFHSQLHPATDDKSMPLRALWRQVIEQTGCSLAVDTGTAGGVGADVVEGDVLLTNACQINCLGQFKDEPFAHQWLAGTWEPLVSNADVATWELLVAVNAHLLSGVADRSPQLWLAGSDESTDVFAFADPEDSYGVVKADPNARMEEMDLMGLVLAVQDLGDKAPRWLSSRCASDPQVPEMKTLEAEKQWAASVYQRYGGAAALGSVEACALVVAGL